MKGSRMVLTTPPKPGHPKAFHRMVFTGIKSYAFTWHWESSTDGGKSWLLQWELRYSRKKLPHRPPGPYNSRIQTPAN